MLLSRRDSVQSVPHDPPNLSSPRACSDFAGCATSFKGAMLVNPYDPDNVAETIYTAITMPVSLVLLPQGGRNRHCSGDSPNNGGVGFPAASSCSITLHQFGVDGGCTMKPCSRRRCSPKSLRGIQRRNPPNPVRTCKPCAMMVRMRASIRATSSSQVPSRPIPY